MIIIIMMKTILTSDATKAADKLSTLLRLVGDNLKCSSKALVVVSKPFQKRQAFNQFQLNTSLRPQHSQPTSQSITKNCQNWQ